MVLVLLQFGCLGVLMCTGPFLPNNTLGIIFLIVAVMIALAATYAFRQSKLTVFPEPRAKAQLITNGIFTYIRHPYYSAVLLYAVAMLTSYFNYWRMLVVLVLLIVLLRKIIHEEKMLCQYFEGYEHYMRHSKKLIPFVW